MLQIIRKIANNLNMIILMIQNSNWNVIVMKRLKQLVFYYIFIYVLIIYTSVCFNKNRQDAVM